MQLWRSDQCEKNHIHRRIFYVFANLTNMRIREREARIRSVPRQGAPCENFVTGNQDRAKDRPYQEHQQNRRKHLSKPCRANQLLQDIPSPDVWFESLRSAIGSGIPLIVQSLCRPARPRQEDSSISISRRSICSRSWGPAPSLSCSRSCCFCARSFAMAGVPMIR